MLQQIEIKSSEYQYHLQAHKLNNYIFTNQNNQTMH